MKLASEATAGLWVPLVPSLDALLARLESLSLEPGLAAQRQIALRLALQPYLEGGAGALLSPLPQEMEGANLLAEFFETSIGPSATCWSVWLSGCAWEHGV